MNDQVQQGAPRRTLTAKEREVIDAALRTFRLRQSQELGRFGRELCNDPRLARLRLRFSRGDHERITDEVIGAVKGALKLKVEPPPPHAGQRLLAGLRQWYRQLSLRPARPPKRRAAKSTALRKSRI